MTQKTVLITGCTSGFGQAIARRFANEGWKTIIVGRRKERLDELAKELQEKAPCHADTLDVRNRDAVETFVQFLPEGFRNVNLLVNNAGLALGIEPADAANIDDWDTMVDTNIKGLMYMTRAILPTMVSQGGGHIINIGSIAGIWPYPGGNCYGATKAFVKQFTYNLRADLVGKNVRVTDIEPGLSKTEFSLIRFKGKEDVAEGVYKDTEPLTPVDIAESVYWAASQPAHVNINTIELMATCQAFSPFNIVRGLKLKD